MFDQLEEKYPTLKFYAVNVDEDHIHFQIEILPNVSVAEVVKIIKTFTSLRLKKQFKFIKKMYFEKE